MKKVCVCSNSVTFMQRMYASVEISKANSKKLLYRDV